MLTFNAIGYLCEDEYIMHEEPKNSTLFTTGNGYMGIRGSFEEFGSLRIQGAFIRGLIDEIIEVIEPFPDNEYMKKFYLDEGKLKAFEYQDSIINFADILLMRVSIDGEVFYPWEGKILSWERYLNTHTAVLHRNVVWENAKGNVTELKFERFASFYDEHVYCQRVTVVPRNHDKPIFFESGIDTRVKTGGQKVCTKISSEVHDDRLFYHCKIGTKYGFEIALAVQSNFFEGQKKIVGNISEKSHHGILSSGIFIPGVENQEYVLEKIIYINTSRDPGVPEDIDTHARMSLEKYQDQTYHQLLHAHIGAYQKYFAQMDISIVGDHEADSALRFSTYHTAISASMNDSVHSLSAKSLSGEKYNNFVWWDCEVYQLPIFIHTAPETAKLALMYRYRLIEKAREIARSKGYQGARYPFVSSVDGGEKVWEYCRHPFMQIHISGDVAWGGINYYRNTRDVEFMQKYGLEIVWEVARYFSCRVEFVNDRYELRNVTGTDEHHPYVHNDAYTNYLAHMVMVKACEYFEELGDCEAAVRIHASIDEMKKFKAIAEKFYLPMERNGLIPQFDGYFELNRELEEAGGHSAKSFQMKKSGLYHKSQVIKQPDVMLIYSLLNIELPPESYAINWDYYEQMCETSSSLSFPPHAICAADNKRMLSFYKNFMKTVRMDIDDLHECAWQGIHAGCAAGGYMAVFRGVFGIMPMEKCIKINPNIMPWWKQVTLSFTYQGATFKAVLTQNRLTLIPLNKQREIEVVLRGRSIHVFEDEVTFDL